MKMIGFGNDNNNVGIADEFVSEVTFKVPLDKVLERIGLADAKIRKISINYGTQQLEVITDEKTH